MLLSNFLFYRLPLSGINCLGPFILRSLGDGQSRMLLNIPFGVLQIIAILGGGIAVKTYRFGQVIVFLSLVSVTGFCALAAAIYTSGPSSLFVLVGYYLTAATYGIRMFKPPRPIYLRH